MNIEYIVKNPFDASGNIPFTVSEILLVATGNPFVANRIVFLAETYTNDWERKKNFKKKVFL